MHRLYSPVKNIYDEQIIINDQTQIHHLKDVLRLKVKEEVVVFNHQGKEYICGIKELARNKVILDIKKEKFSFNLQQKTKITIACAIPKKSRMDELIDKLTQLGVDRIIPLVTERVIVRLDKNKKISRLERWKRIALSASQQSQRNTLPVIEPIKHLKEVLSSACNYDLKLIPHLTGKRKTLKEIFAKTNPKNILVLIGPEGDFTLEEMNLAKKAGCIPVSLGDGVLRVETAAIAIVSFIRLYCLQK